MPGLGCENNYGKANYDQNGGLIEAVNIEK